ncbi:MAG TPA: PhzF family phenazine biosynthesis protein, partial [Xanthomonadales bacterium]|nr:PhzF family phenazine biosynthesis protein [Xanthomonadales bacterium]
MRYLLLNVFAESRFGGNPLAVVEDGRGLGDDEMQAVARQFNLSETTFLLPSAMAAARVRIFTPSYEMGFAGHPTLGSAEAVRMLLGAGDRFELEMKAGPVAVDFADGTWWLRANEAKSRPLAATRDELAATLGLPSDALLGPRAWFDNGNEQPMLPLASVEHVAACRPVPELVAKHCRNALGQPKLYVFARTATGFVSRYFAIANSGAMYEDPGTGSAAANLGAWWQHAHGAEPLRAEIAQGDAIARPCRLHLDVRDGVVRVGG